MTMKQSVNKSIFLILVLLLPIMPYSEAASEETNQTNPLYSPISTFYPFDGEGHHPVNGDFNKVGSDLSRISPSSGNFQDDYISRPDSLSAREISNTLCKEEKLVLDANGVSDYNWIWGQFLSHDISFVLTQNGRVNGTPETMHIPIPQGDEWMDPFSVGSLIMSMDRSVYNISTSTEEIAREFPNSITGWLDGSHVYGSSINTSNWLRSFEHGKLKTYSGFNGEFLPLADEDDSNTPPVSFASFSPSKRYVAGDPRANEHAALTAIHVLFVREHNRLAEEINENNPSLTDEEIYQLARKINTAQMQYITYYEYLPSLGISLPDYTGFDPEVDPRISNSFAVIAFRMGHSQITDTTLRLDHSYQSFSRGNISMADGFWNPDRLNNEGGIAPIFRGAAMTIQAASDTKYTDGLRNSMFGDPGFGGLDMCAIDIQRGRGHGLPDYNTLRTAIGLDSIENWSEIISGDGLDYDNLSLVYPDIDNADPIMGMYAEPHLPGGVLGETMHALLSDQYQRLRDGDILYFENDQEIQPYLDQVTQSSLAKIILRNTEITTMQCDVMYAVDSVNDMDCFHPEIPKYHTDSHPDLEQIDTGGNPFSDLSVSFKETTQTNGLSAIIFEKLLMWSAKGPTLSIGDCNNDGNEDLWVGASFDHIGFETGNLESHSRTYLLLGDGMGNFFDYSEQSGLLEYNSTALSATWVDYDNDGDVDLYQSNDGIISDFGPSKTNSTRNTLYSNNGNCVFADVTSVAGLENNGYSSSSSWGDYDNDGDLDLYSMNLGIVDEINRTVYPQSNILYHNFLIETGSAYFEDYTAEVGDVYGGFITPENNDELSFGDEYSYKVKSTLNPSAQGSIVPNAGVPIEEINKGSGVTWAGLFVDLNSDGGDDLLIASDFGISPLYENTQNGKFLLHTKQSEIDISGTAMGFDAADFDGDLDLDYCQSNFGPNFLFEQTGDLVFESVGTDNGMSVGVASQSVTWDCNFFDIDLDGDLDLWFGSGNVNPYTTFSPNTIYLNDGDGNFLPAIVDVDSQLFSPIGKTMGSVWADFDKDGDLDAIISQSNTGVHYFENNAADNNNRNWIGIDVYKHYTNDSVKIIANGAIVDIYLSNGKSIRQVVKIGSGYAGSKDTTINLGIPEGESLTKVVITWKDGTVNEYRDLEINQYHALEPNDSFNQQESLSTQDDSSLVTLSVILITILIVFVRFFPRQD